MICKYWIDENDTLTIELEDARTSQTQLESRARELEAILHDGGGGYDDAVAWWEG